MKVRKIGPEAEWQNRRSAFLKLTAEEDVLMWLQTIQSRVKGDTSLKGLKVYKRIP